MLLSWPGVTSSELARRSFVRAQSMAGTLGPLVEQGLISRAPDPGNARRLLLDDQQLDALSAALRTLRHNIQDLSTSTP
ncbi:MarR family transcriptional regulator [Cellulosimicrobium funkei]|nr:MarR family transcriptional regulator [Cellulosimicrobium funkei]